MLHPIILPPESPAFSVIAKRLAPWFVGIAAYGIVVSFLVREWGLQLTTLGAEISVANSIVLGLLLSFRNGAAFDRWWEAHKLWGQLINDTRNLAWKLRMRLPAEVIRERQLAAVLIGFAESLKRHLRQKTTLSEVAGFEKDLANPAHVPSYLVGRLFADMADWQKQGLIDGYTAMRLDPHVRGLIDVCGACERIRHTPISRSYVFLLRFGIAINILATPWFSMRELGLWGLPIVLILGFFLLGVESVDTEVEEPFGVGTDDLKLERYCTTIRQSVEEILNV